MNAENVNSKQGGASETLKIIAIVAMLIDHLALLLPWTPYNSLLVACMRFIGRLAAPIMFFFIVEGYHHTRNIDKYTSRLALFALISYLPFVLFYNNGLPTSLEGWLKLNVIYTLLLGLLALRARYEVKNSAASVCLVGLCLLASVFGDWYYIGVISILFFDLLRGSLKNQRIGFCLIILFWGVLPLAMEIMTGAAKGDLVINHLTTIGVRLGLLVPMLLLGRYNGQRGPSSKWLFYIFYPTHLLLLYFVAKWLNITINV